MQRLTSGSKRKYLKLFFAVLLTSMTLLFLTVSVVAQEVKTDNQQPADQAQQPPAPTQMQESLATPEQPETVTKTAYFGPMKMAWDTTAKYSSTFRLADRSNKLTSLTRNPSNSNQDDGDNNFGNGMVGDRLDFLTEMDVSFGKNFGFRGSAAAWFDPTYNSATKNRSAASINAYSGDPAHFTAQAKDLQYLQAELLDAFVHASIPLGKSTLSFRAGQFAQQWGQSVFFGSNAIAGGMAPMDLLKLLSVPNAQFKEVIRPVPQVSATLQLTPTVSVGAYYQLMWVETRFPGVGSYFSNSDVLGQGAEKFWWGAGPVLGQYLTHVKDITPKNAGQFGVQIQVRAPRGWDLGFYGIQFHDKTPIFYLTPSTYDYGNPANFFTSVGAYRWVYAQNIKAFGVSATKTTGLINWAAEVSGRINQDLSITGVTTSFPTPFGLVELPAGNGKHDFLFPTGDTLHANVSALVTLPVNRIAKDSSIMAEVAWNDLLSVTHNNANWVPTVVNPAPLTMSGGNATKQAIAMMAVYTPTYHQVRPGLDVSIPIGINYSPYGRSVLGPGFATENGGFFNIGASLAFRDANRFTVTYQRFIGDQGGSVLPDSRFSYKQAYGDRNYLAFSIYRTFGVRASQKAH